LKSICSGAMNRKTAGHPLTVVILQQSINLYRLGYCAEAVL